MSLYSFEHAVICLINSLLFRLNHPHPNHPMDHLRPMHFLKFSNVFMLTTFECIKVMLIHLIITIVIPFQRPLSFALCIALIENVSISRKRLKESLKKV